MIDPNTRTDYNKMKKLIRLDKLDGNRKGVLRWRGNGRKMVEQLCSAAPMAEFVYQTERPDC